MHDSEWTTTEPLLFGKWLLLVFRGLSKCAISDWVDTIRFESTVLLFDPNGQETLNLPHTEAEGPKMIALGTLIG